jgi:LPXTG-site transpeptidase (sortase) family protein
VKLTRVNTVLLIAIVLINGYIMALPVLPGLLFWWQTKDGKQTAQLEQKIRTLSADKPLPVAEQPKENRLIVPAMAFDQPVFEGKTARTLNNGLWHRPQSSTPDKGGNTVFVGHRLTYTNPRGTLYHLDKVRAGDTIGIWWNNKPYSYTVTETKVVKADQTSIEASTDEPQLTIYTCTPLWLPKDRLVVIAKLEDSHE